MEEEEENIKQSFITRLLNRISLMFQERYELTVTFPDTIEIDVDGKKTIHRTQKVFLLNTITKKTQTHIVGKDDKNKLFEIKTVEPFDYQIRRII